MPREVTPEDYPKVGSYYEDAFFHPCLCTYVSYEDDEIHGISLVDGTVGRCASMHHNFVRMLTFEEAIHYRYFGPLDSKLEPDRDWTQGVTVESYNERHRIQSHEIKPNA